MKLLISISLLLLLSITLISAPEIDNPYLPIVRDLIDACPDGYFVNKVDFDRYVVGCDNATSVIINATGGVYVPYTGATEDVYLGAHNLSVGSTYLAELGDGSNEASGTFTCGGGGTVVKICDGVGGGVDSSANILTGGNFLGVGMNLDDYGTMTAHMLTRGVVADFDDGTNRIIIGDNSGLALNVTGDSVFDGNVTADWFKGKFNWTSGDDWNIFDGFNLTFNETKLASIFYNATQSNNITGTIDGGTLGDTQHSDGAYDGTTLNFSEVAGSPGLDLRINFTGIPDFNQGVMRYKTSNLVGNYPIIQLWNYDDSVWEDYPLVSESLSFATISQPVFDSTHHINGGLVQMRIYKASNGNTNNHYYVDWIAIAKGFGTPSGEEVDPLSHHRNSNLDINGYNITNISLLNVTGNSFFKGNVSIIGYVNASDFYGDGSGLTGIIGSTAFNNTIEDYGDGKWLQLDGGNDPSSDFTWSTSIDTSDYLEGGSSYVGRIGDDSNSRAVYGYDSSSNVGKLADGSYGVYGYTSSGTAGGYFENSGGDYCYLGYSGYGADCYGSSGGIYASDGYYSAYLADGSYAGNFYGDVYISGTITASGGSDPPYLVYFNETRASVIEKMRLGIPPERANGIAQFYNSELDRIEYIKPSTCEFFISEGAKLTKVHEESEPCYNTNFKIVYVFNPVTGKVDSHQAAIKPTYGYDQKKYSFDKSTGQFLDKESNEIVEIDEVVRMENKSK